MKKNVIFVMNGIGGQKAAAIIREAAKRLDTLEDSKAYPVRWTVSFTGKKYAFSWDKIYAIYVNGNPNEVYKYAYKMAKTNDDEATFWLADIRYSDVEKFEESIKRGRVTIKE